MLFYIGIMYRGFREERGGCMLLREESVSCLRVDRLHFIFNFYADRFCLAVLENSCLNCWESFTEVIVVVVVCLSLAWSCLSLCALIRAVRFRCAWLRCASWVLEVTRIRDASVDIRTCNSLTIQYWWCYQADIPAASCLPYGIWPEEDWSGEQEERKRR